ncbi:MAG: enoyl-CoA hydratase family protein [Planctomycetota bacterium]
MPAPYEGFQWDVRDGVGTVTLSRPDKLNALTFGIYNELVRLFGEVGRDDSVRSIIIRGEGRAFCSGGDVNEIIGVLLDQSVEERLDFTRMTCALVRNIRRCPQPVVAELHGAVAGAGAVISVASDLRVAAKSTRISFLFTKVGLTGADMGAAWLLPRIVGFGHASRILLLGDRVESDEAERIGLVNRVVPDGEEEAAAREWAQRLADGARDGIRATKRLLQAEMEMDFDTALDTEAAGQAVLLAGADHREYHAAFNEKRKPVFRRPESEES